MIGICNLDSLVHHFFWPTSVNSIKLYFRAQFLPVAQAYLGDMTPEGQEGRWMGYFNAIMFAGLGAGPLVGGIMNDVMGITSVFIVSGVAIFISYLATVVFLEQSSRKYHQEGTRVSWSVIRQSETLGAVLLLQVSAGLLFGMTMAFLPVLAANKLALSTSLIGLILAVRTPISMLQSYSGRLADSHNRKTQIIVGNLIAACAIGIMSLSTGFYSLFAIHSLLCLGMVCSQPASSAYIVEEGRTIGMGAAMALFLMAMQAGAGMGPIVVGWIMDSVGFDQGFVTAAIFNLSVLALFLWLLRDIPGKKIDELDQVTAD